MIKNNNEVAVSPVIGVILMVAITVILAAVIAAFVFGMAGNVQKNAGCCNGCEQEYSSEISVAATDFGSYGWNPFYVISTEPFTYEIPYPSLSLNGREMYDYATKHVCQNVTITYKKSYRNGCEIRTITSIKALCENQCGCGCTPCCVTPTPTPTPACGCR